MQLCAVQSSDAYVRTLFHFTDKHRHVVQDDTVSKAQHLQMSLQERGGGGGEDDDHKVLGALGSSSEEEREMGECVSGFN